MDCHATADALARNDSSFSHCERSEAIYTNKVDSSKSLSDSEIVDEKTRQSRSFFSKCGLQAKAQGGYLDGNDRRAFVQLPHLSSKAESLTTQKLSAKTLLTLGIIFNLCLLGIFKYTDFFLENFNLFSKLLALDFTIPLPHILLPLALSFVTFQQIAFLVDCYKQVKAREEAKRLESNIENNAESKSQHSLTQATLSTTTAKEKRFIPSPLPLAQKSKATAFLFCNQGESLAISASSTQAAIGTTAYRQSAFAHHEAGENRCAFGTLNELYSANAEYKKPMLKTNNEIPHINFLDYCLFITFFPQLIAGPIVHHREMMPQFYAMSRRDSVLSDKSAIASRALQLHTLSMRLCTRSQSPDFSSQSLESQTKNKPAKDSRIFTQEVQNVAKSQAAGFCDDFGGCQAQSKGAHLACVTADLRADSHKSAQKPTPEPSQAESSNPNTTIINWEYIAKGLFIFSIGLFKKVVIADSFAKWANAGSKAIESGVMLNFFESWATALSHMFEYYFDFSGYCDMAIGLGLLFGIILPVNFNSPFKSLNIAEFWRRWHITLGRFLKHYVYIPLGGSRCHLIFNLRNLFLVFLISGLWHGAGWGFIIWGSIHGLSVVIHKLYTLFYKKLDSASLYLRFMQTRIYILLCWILTFMVVLLARVFYVSPSLKDAFVLLKGMFGGEIIMPSFLESKLAFLGQWGITFGAWLEHIQGSSSTILWIFLAFILALGCKNSVQLTDSLGKRAVNIKLAIAGVAFVWAMCVSLESSYVPKFLYFNF
ncbi:hypothetical protein HMPREF2087_00533 [Helicobacter canis NCTC 12740]|uniref:MBOAT family protein n=1 Tax=Helicobacter canis NCTC 12740 TaxID=1357399 RepID=V8CKR2_9HELI|nr:hypothetical protein HMPREF2087_00533 [Helicobacter canis NCTC 12740]